MKATDRTIVVGLALVGLIAGFWFLVLSPKRDRASELESEVTTLQASVANYESMASAAEEAEESFDDNYKSLVVLGKAVPSDSDTSSLFVQLNELASGADVSLDSIEISEGGAAPPPPPAAETTADSAAPEPAPADSTTVPAAAPVAPTEAAASTLPLGATVGPAGLPVMPYTLSLNGSFFGLADFLKSVDDLVGYADGRPAVNGRLLTIDGFSLSPEETDTGAAQSGGGLTAALAITSYVSPADEGATAGATPTGPPPAASTPVSTTTPPAAVIP